MTFSTITISQKFVSGFVTKRPFFCQIGIIFSSLRIKVTKFIFADKTASELPDDTRLRFCHIFTVCSCNSPYYIRHFFESI